MLVTINGEKYVAESIKQVPVNPLADAFRVTGVQQRSDNVKLNRFSFSNWNEVGIGSSRLRRQHQNAEGEIKGQQIGAMRDADAETRFSNAITLPLLNQTVAHATPSDHLITHEHFKGELWGIFEEDYASDALQNISALYFDAAADNWTSGNSSGVFNPTVAGSSNGAGASSSITVSRAVQSSIGNRISIAIVSHEAAADPSGVTEAGNSMTKYTSRAYTGSGTQMNISAWYKINPTTGTQNYIASGLTGDNAMVVFDLHSCPQTNPFRTAAETAGGDVEAATMNTTSTAGDLVVGGVSLTTGSAAITSAITSGSGQTELAEPANSSLRMAVSHEAAAVGGALTTAHTYAWSNTNHMAAISFAIIGGGRVAVTDDNAHGLRAFGSAVHKGELWIIGSAGSGDELKYMVYSSANGSTWATEAASAFPTADYLQTSVTRVADGTGWKHRYADLLDDGANLIAAVYEDPDSSGGSISQVRIGYTANTGTGWTFNAGLIIPCTDTPNIKLLHFNDLHTAGTPQVPILVTSDNVYKLDIGNNVFQELLPTGILTGTADEALGAEVGADGKLYISKAGGDILQISFPQQSVREIVNVGPQSKAHYEESDGLVTARQGHANYISGSDPRWLFVAYGGHAGSKNASILAMNYETGAWHSFFRNSTADEDITTLVISTESDGTPRLHASAEGAAACTAFMFEEPLVAAVTGVTQNYKTTGYVEWAEDDLGDPHTSAAVMRALIDDGGTMGSGTTTNYVQLKYGLDGAAYDNVTLGNFLSTAKSLNFDATNNRGVSAKTLKVRLNLFGADAATTNTPQIKEYEIQARNRVSVLRGWEIAIDLDASAEFQSTEQPPNPETVVSNLLTVQNSVTLVPLVVGEGAEAQVEMTTGEWMLELIDVSGGDGLQSGRVSGRAIVVLEEVV